MSIDPDDPDCNSIYETVFFNIADFLTEYEKLPCLWDKSREDFKDRKVRLIAEEGLGEKLGIYDLFTLRKKIRSVRGTYNTEIRKIKQSLDCGTGLYIPKLSWFPWADKFLRVTTELPLDIDVTSFADELQTPKKKLLKKLPRKSGVTVVMVGPSNKNDEDATLADAYDQQDDENEELDDDAYEEEVLELEEHDTEDENLQLKQEVTDDSNMDTFEHNHNHTLIQSEEHNQSDFKPTVKKRKRIQSKKCNCESLVEVVSSLKDICQTSENEFAVFGRSVGVQLQNMPIELAVQLQTDIQAHITMTRLEYLRKRKIRDEE